MPHSVSFSTATFRALLNRLIPRDDFPGALDAGVKDYVERQFSGDGASEAELFARGLVALEAESAVQYVGVSFAALEEEQQDALLRRIEAGAVSATWPEEIPAPVFFTRLCDLVHEGFYADPANGGNRDAVSWKMIGYETRMPLPAARVPASLESPPPPSGNTHEG